MRTSGVARSQPFHSAAPAIHPEQGNGERAGSAYCMSQIKPDILLCGKGSCGRGGGSSNTWAGDRLPHFLARFFFGADGEEDQVSFLPLANSFPEGALLRSLRKSFP